MQIVYHLELFLVLIHPRVCVLSSRNDYTKENLSSVLVLQFKNLTWLILYYSDYKEYRVARQRVRTRELAKYTAALAACCIQ